MTKLRDVNLIDLNNDVLYDVIDHLNVFDKINLRKVCKRLRSIVDIHSARKFKSFYVSAPLDKHFDDIIQNFGVHLRELHLVTVNNRLNKLNEQMTWLNKYCGNLSTLKVEARAFRSSMCLNSELVLLDLFVNLTHFELANIRFQDESEFKHFSNFQVLKLENAANFTGSSWVHLTRLRVLELRLCDDLRLDNLIKIFRNNKGLKDLSLIKCQQADRLGFDDIVKEIPQIERLNLHFCWPSRDKPNVLNNLKKLVSLKIHNLVQNYDVGSYIEDLSISNRLESWEIDGESMIFSNLNPNTLERLGVCTRMTELSFKNCYFITDTLLTILGRKLRLKKFSLDNCSGFTANGLLTFSVHSMQLAHLQIKNCLVPQSIKEDIVHAVSGTTLPHQKLSIFYDINCGFRPYEADDGMDYNISTEGSWCH